MEAEISSSPLSCGYIPNDNTTKYMVVGILHTCSATLSFFSCFLVIALILLLKKYRFFVQRLILYLSITALLYSLAAALAKTDYRSPDDFPHGFCTAMGFITQYTQWSLLLSITIITLDILIRVCLNRSTHGLELIYILVIMFLPALFNWLPFLYNMYGPSGAWCWIKTHTLDNQTCSFDDKGVIFQFALWYAPLFLILLAILVSYAVIMFVLRSYKRKMNIYNNDEVQMLRTMRREVFILMWYPIIYMVINLVPLANRIIDAAVNRTVYELWVMHAIISPLQGGFIAIVYAFDPETRRKLTFIGIRNALCQCLRRDRGNVREYSAEIVNRSDGSESPLLKKSFD